MQDFRAFPLFLRQEIWDDLANPDQTQLTRVDRLARYLVNELGLRHPSEPSQAVMSALVGARDNLQIPQLRTLLQTVKSVVRTTVTRANHAGIALPAGTYLEVLPNQVQELPDAVRQQVAPGGFAAVPANVSLDVVWQTARTIPLRSTHRDVQLQRQLERSENIIGLTDSRMAGVQMAQLGAAFAIAMSGQMGHRPSEPALSNLQIFASQEAQMRRSSPNAMQQLMDRAQASGPADARSSAATKPVEAQSESLVAARAAFSATQPLAASSSPQEAQSHAAGSAPSIAAPASAAPLITQEAPSASFVAGRVAPTATPESAAPSAPGALPGAMPAAALPEPMLALEDGRQESAKVGDQSLPSEERVDQKSSDFAQAPPEVADTVRRLAHAHYGKTLRGDSTEGEQLQPAKRRGRPPMKRPAACEPAEIGAEKTQGTASGMKRPASKAVASSLRKRPASKAVPSSPRKRPASKAAAEKFVIITEKERHKERPDGCGRCRNTPGCCPSCWRLRGFEPV